MEQILKEAKGIGGRLQLLEEKIRIRRKGVSAVMLHGLKGDKEIFLTQISSIQFKKAGPFVNGYIQFAFLGGQESKGGAWSATTDENTIMFRKSRQADFEEIKSMIEMKIKEQRNKTVGKSGTIDDLEKLAQLKDKGIISEEEFKAKKKQILGL